MSHKEEELKAGLKSLLVDLIKKRETMYVDERIIGLKGAVRTVDYPIFLSLGRSIRSLERIKSMPMDSLQFVKPLIEIEYLFKKSSALKNYTLPNFRAIINPDTIIYANIEHEIDKLETVAEELNTKEIIAKIRNSSDESDDEEDSIGFMGSKHYIAARDIAFYLRNLNESYFKYKEIDYDTYKRKALDIINKGMPKIDTHHGLKQILGNLLILITTLGAAHLINKACNGNFLFFRTDLAQQVNSINNTIKTIYKT